MGIWMFPKEAEKFLGNQGSEALKTKALPCNSVLQTKRNRSILGFSKGHQGVRREHCGSAAALLLGAWRLLQQILSCFKLKLPTGCSALSLEETAAVKWQLVICVICNLEYSGWQSWVSQGFELVLEG